MKRYCMITAAIIFALMLSCCGRTPYGGGNGKQMPREMTADKILAEMSLEEKVWQMFFVAPEDIIDIDTAIQAGDATRKAIEAYPVGGIIYFGKNIESRNQIKEMIANTQSFSKIPLFISVDEEGGRVARLADAGVIDKQPPMAQIGLMGDDGIAEAERIGEFFGTELSSLGFNMDFAPVADVITSENNDIGDRSFGTDPELTAKLVVSEVRGMQSHNVSATLKHFPSNGSAEGNTHYGKAVCTRTLEEMRECEFIPFKAGIDAGADVVMAAHMAAAELTGDETPSTLSPVIIQDYLRGELGFGKLVISDALNMGAITDSYTPSEAAVMAVEAGVDMLLMSPDVKTAVGAVTEKVRSGEISESRIDESVRRILNLKIERGLIR